MADERAVITGAGGPAAETDSPFSVTVAEIYDGPLDLLLDLSENMTGKTICVLSDSCATPVVSGLKKFRDDFEVLIKRKKAHLVPAVA